MPILQSTMQNLEWWRHIVQIVQHRKRNRPFPSSLVPLFQSESKCETILMKMTLICKKMNLHAELVFIWKVLHLDSFWKRGARELGNGLFPSMSVKAVEKGKPTNQDGWNICYGLLPSISIRLLLTIYSSQEIVLYNNTMQLQNWIIPIPDTMTCKLILCQ